MDGSDSTEARRVAKREAKEIAALPRPSPRSAIVNFRALLLQIPGAANRMIARSGVAYQIDGSPGDARLAMMKLESQGGMNEKRTNALSVSSRVPMTSAGPGSHPAGEWVCGPHFCICCELQGRLSDYSAAAQQRFTVSYR